LRRLAIAAWLIVAAGAGSAPAAEENRPLAEGAIAQVQGQAVVLDGSGRTRPAKVGEILRGGEILETKADGRVRAILVDKSVIEVRPNSRVQINDSRLNPRGVSSVLVYVGWIWARVTARPGPDYAFEIEAPTTVAGVRGTELEAAVAEDGSARVGVSEGRAVMENDAGSLSLGQGQSGEAGYKLAPAIKGRYSAQADFWLNFLQAHHLAEFSEIEVFIVKVVAALLDTRAELLKDDTEFRKDYRQFEERHPAPAAEPEKKTEPKPEKEALKEEAAQATEVRRLYLQARATQKAANRLGSNYYLAERARTAAAGTPGRFSAAQLQTINTNLVKVQDVPQIHRQSRLALDGFAAVLEHQVSRYGISSALGRMPALERNAQIQQVLKQIPGAMPPMPSPQSLPKPVMPPIPSPRMP
jgi:hypothetical protein